MYTLSRINGPLTCFLEAARVEPEPDIQHPPRDLAVIFVTTISCYEGQVTHVALYGHGSLRLSLLARQVSKRVWRSIFENRYARPKRIQKPTKAKRRDHHQEQELHDHGAEGQDHKVVLEGDEGESE